MAKKVRWGIIGCARIAERAVIPAIRASRNGELWTIASRDESKAKAWAARYGFKRAYGDYAAACSDPEIDAVYNPLPNHLHAPWTIAAARAGKNVLCEKPLALDAGEVQAMFRAAKRSGVLLMEAFMYRFHPQIERAFGYVRDGLLGDPRLVRSAFTFSYAGDGRNYRWNSKMGGGALYDVGCYPVSAGRTVFGAEPVSVFARARFHPRRGIDVTAAMVLEFPGARFALCDAGFETPFQSWLEIVGTEGRLALPRAYSPKDFDVPIQITRGDVSKTIVVPAANPYTRMVEHFGDAVLKGRPLRYGEGDALGQALVLDAAFRSMKTGRPAGPALRRRKMA
jgi:predicted dehydrogenase